MIILGIETSCDETAAAVVENGTTIVSNIVASSQQIHQKYGGVVPEVAAREQATCIIPVIEEALLQAHCKPSELDAIAVTVGPGLIGSLLIGVETAKTLAWVWHKPLIPVNHLVGHIYANWLQPQGSIIRDVHFPAVCLVVSGGHTDLVLMRDHGQFQYLGGTRDDAAGEAFDKIARLLGLGYPGGPAIEKAAATGNPQAIALPSPLIHSGDYDFSFSGLKTAVARAVQTPTNNEQSADIAASFQHVVVNLLTQKTIAAAKEYQAQAILVGGGVAANQELRKQLMTHGEQLGIPVLFPAFEFATDNAACIAAAAYFCGKPTPWPQAQADVSFSLENITGVRYNE